jgi:anti-anti-sigma factor
MQLDFTKLEKAAVVKVTGRMDAENATEFSSACEKWLDDGAKNFVIDLTGLAYVSSLGLRSFLTVAQATQKAGGKMVLCGLQGLPKQVFELTRLISLFPLFQTVEEAVSHI